MWKAKGASPWIVSVLKEGYNLEFSKQPVLSSQPAIVSGYQDLRKQQELADQIRSLVDKGALEVVHNVDSKGFYSRMFLVPKKSGGWRPIIDLSVLNTYLVPIKFKMETNANIRASLVQNWWTFSLDLKDAYLHIPIHPTSRKYLRIAFQGVVYQFKALPFGLSPAPWLFTKVVTEVKNMVHNGASCFTNS